jgi:Arc/MetJ-type ribon-helix-helix transcriptional regulator
MSTEIERLKISLDRETIKWIDERIALKQFADRSEAIDYALKALRSSEGVHPFDREA